MSKLGDHASLPISSIGLQPIRDDLQQAQDPDLRSRLAASLTWHNVRTLSYFVIWFALSVVYNVCNKKVDEALTKKVDETLSMTADGAVLKEVDEASGTTAFLASIQMSTGVPIITFLWLTGLRKPPSISNRKLFLMLCLMALFHTATHLGGVLSMGGKGAVYLTQVIKATEPVFTALLSVVILGQIYAWQVYLFLVGVCVGCIIVSISQASFESLPLVFALVSALGAALRGTLSKEALKTVPAECNLKAQNLYYVLTVISTIYCCICFVAVDLHKVMENLNRALTNEGHVFVWGNIIGSGLSYYLYNEVAFLALDSVSPVTHAIGSTSKRVFIIAASLIVFRDRIDAWGYTGMTIAIVCVFIYSLAKIRYPGRTIRKPFSYTTSKD